MSTFKSLTDKVPTYLPLSSTIGAALTRISFMRLNADSAGSKKTIRSADQTNQALK